MSKMLMGKWVRIALLVILTGGFWLIFSIIGATMPTYRRAWALRMHYLTAKADEGGAASPWQWLRWHWLAAFCGLVSVLFWSMVYLATLQAIVPSSLAGTPTLGTAMGLADMSWIHWAVLPIPLAFFAWLGSLAALLVETLWPDKAIAATSGWLKRLRTQARLTWF